MSEDDDGDDGQGRVYVTRSFGSYVGEGIAWLLIAIGCCLLGWCMRGFPPIQVVVP